MTDLFAPADSIGRVAIAALRRGHKAKRRSEGKQSNVGEREFAWQCMARQLPVPVSKFVRDGKQYRLLRTKQVPRKDGKNIPSRWYFDFVWPEYQLITEIDGGIWIGGAHAHPLDLTRNMEKRNDAALAGFVILSFTPRQVKQGEAIDMTIRVLSARGWKAA